MKKIYLYSFSVALLILYSVSASANVVTGQAAIPDGYYNGVDGKSSADAILDALFSKIQGHTVINYNSLENYYDKTDMYSDTIWDMYSTCNFSIDDANCSQKAICDCWNKEHSIPQSWFKEGSPMKSDLFHVYPTDARVNNFRSNYPYGEVSGGNGTGFKDNYQNHGLGKLGTNTFPGYTGKVFEPADEYKGDFARTYFYMVARYRDRDLTNSEGSNVFTSNKTNLTDFAKNLFLKWHRQDPVSDKEVDRNQAVYGIQKNRNPFIDYPELAEYIWGNKVGQQVDLSSMTPTCDGGGTTPVVTVKHGVSWSVNGEIISVDSIVENKKPTSLPGEPTSCSTESKTFVGWTNAPISGTSDVAPAVLYTAAAEFPVVTADITYYAVFAHAETSGSSAPATYTYDSNHQDGWTNTAENKGSYWLLVQGNYIESPAVDLSGLSSITMNIRTYGGSSNNTVSIKAADKEIATLTANNNKLNDYTWNNTGSLSGVSPLLFTAEAHASQGVGFASITINATGSSTSYSAYLTNCGTTDIENHESQITNHKYLRDGRLYIQVGEQVFTIMGQRVK